MSTIEAASGAIEAYDALLERALSIIDKAPYWTYVHEPFWARLDIEGDEATLSLPRAGGGGYDDPCTIEREDVTFLTALLFLSEEELAAWKAEQMSLYEEAEQQRKANNRAAAEADERRVLATLKAKYEQ